MSAKTTKEPEAKAPEPVVPETCTECGAVTETCKDGVCLACRA